jgi:hypothetical protein
MAVTPDGRVVSGSRDGAMRVWAESGELEVVIRVDTSVTDVALASGSRMVIGTSKGPMLLELGQIEDSGPGKRPVGRRGDP